MNHKNRFAATLAAVCAVGLSMAGGSRFAVGGLNFEATTDSTAQLVLGDSFYRDTVVVPASVTAPGSTQPLAVTAIGRCGFNGCHALRAVQLPATISEIGDFAFNACDSLKAISLPDGVTRVGEHAFSGCAQLKSIVIPDAVQSVGDYAFHGCTQLATVSFGKGVTSIGYRALQRCTQLRTINVADGNATYSVSGGYLLTDGGRTLVTAARKRSDYRTPTLPTQVTAIADYAFAGCDNLISIELPAALTTVGKHAFQGCTRLSEISLPEATFDVGANAFADCSVLNSVHCRASVPMALSSYYDPFTLIGRQALMTLYVPAGTAEAYRAASVWSGFGIIVEEESGVEPTAVHAAVAVSVDGRTITVTGAPDGSRITVWNISGAVVASGTSTQVTVPAAGAYVVMAGSKAVKVMVR